MDSYKNKYLKYKSKYLNLKGGTISVIGNSYSPCLTNVRSLFLNQNVKLIKKSIVCTLNMSETDKTVKEQFINEIYNLLISNNFNKEIVKELSNLYKTNNYNDYLSKLFGEYVYRHLLLDGKSLLSKFNLLYSNFVIPGISADYYPYGPSDLFDKLSYSNNTFNLINNKLFQNRPEGFAMARLILYLDEQYIISKRDLFNSQLEGIDFNNNEQNENIKLLLSDQSQPLLSRETSGTYPLIGISRSTSIANASTSIPRSTSSANSSTDVLRSTSSANSSTGVSRSPSSVNVLTSVLPLPPHDVLSKCKEDTELQSTKIKYKFIEVIRFEKIKEPLKNINSKFVLQDKKSEIISDPGYLSKGIYYYPCIGSGVFLAYKKSLNVFNKLDAIIKMHKMLIDSNTDPNIINDKCVLYNNEFFNYSDLSKNTNILLIPSQNIIEKLITELTVGIFNIKDSINVSLFNYLIRATKLSYLADFSDPKKKDNILPYLLSNYNKNKMPDSNMSPYKLYNSILEGELLINELIDFYKLYNPFNIYNEEYNLLNLLKEKLLKKNNNDNSIFTDLKLKYIITEPKYFLSFSYGKQYMKLYIYEMQFQIDYDREELEQMFYNIMIELYSKIYCANFNQILLDATMFFYARQNNIDTIILSHEPTDKLGFFGCEIIAIEDYQYDSFLRTISLKDINPEIKNYYTHYIR